MNLIPDELRASYRQAFADLHDTFGKEIVVWTAPEEVIVESEPQYNGFYQRPPVYTTQIIPQSGVFKARIKYLTSQEMLESVGAPGGDQRMKFELGGVRVRVSGDAVEMMNKSERVTFNNEVHTVVKRDRPHGIVDNQFYDYILQRVA